jgi:hypothetical protein
MPMENLVIIQHQNTLHYATICEGVAIGFEFVGPSQEVYVLCNI